MRVLLLETLGGLDKKTLIFNLAYKMHSIWPKYNGKFLIRGTKCCLEYTLKLAK